MAVNLFERFRNAWNSFMSRDAPNISYGSGSSQRPDRHRYSRRNEKSIVTAFFNRIAVDCAAIDIKHVRVDEKGRYKDEINSGLNYCLNVEANIDQTGRAFKQDIYESLLDDGSVAIVPVDVDGFDEKVSIFKIKTMRVGKILEWFPSKVKIRCYDERSGEKKDIIVPKEMTAIVENPFYAVMNEPNSIAQRLIRKMSLLDGIDEQASAGKLDLIIQLPYTIRTPLKQEQAEKRKKDIEEQLTNSKYGIAYIDAAEHITQLNRPLENNLMAQIEYLTTQLESQLGFSTSILDGTADEKTMLNYTNRVLEPIISAVVSSMYRSFLTKTARSQGQSLMFFTDPFRLVPVSSLAEMADKFTRNEIMSSNEFRQIMGFPPIDSKEADELRNKNLSPGKEQHFASTNDKVNNQEGDEIQNE